jgi:hypothetical protein
MVVNVRPDLKPTTMTKKTILTLLGILFFNLSFGQDQQKYSELVTEAQNLYKNKEYLKSAQKYSLALKNINNPALANDRIAAACSWAQANVTDSAFIQLFKVALDSNFISYNYLMIIPGLKSLYSDKRWNRVIEQVKANDAKIERNLDMLLVPILDTVFIEDQRLQYIFMENKNGRKSEEIDSLNKVIRETDSLNLIRVKKILDTRGWIGEDIIGNFGNLALFLVIQHSTLETQEKYLPMMREAVKRGNASPSNLALLEDRVALGEGKKQIYGSQIGSDEVTGEAIILPLEDPDNVDKRRAEVGLEKLQDYLSNFGIKWDVNEYKKKLPKIEVK